MKLTELESLIPLSKDFNDVNITQWSNRSMIALIKTDSDESLATSIRINGDIMVTWRNKSVILDACNYENPSNDALTELVIILNILLTQY